MGWVSIDLSSDEEKLSYGHDTNAERPFNVVITALFCTVVFVDVRTCISSFSLISFTFYLIFMTNRDIWQYLVTFTI